MNCPAIRRPTREELRPAERFDGDADGNIPAHLAAIVLNPSH